MGVELGLYYSISNLLFKNYMPQFDTMTFFNQVFWLISIVFAFYIIALGYMLPVLAFSLKSRSKNLKFTAALKNKVK